MAQKIACLHQKGGVGKTTINVLIANYLANKAKMENTGEKVLLIDCDANQSLTGLRQLDMASGHKIEDSYKFITIEATSILDVLDFFNHKYDYIIFDMPGTINVQGVLSSYVFIDYIFMPLLLSKVELKTSIQFYNLISKELPKIKEKCGFPPPTIYGIHNKIDLKNFDDKNFVQNGITPYTTIPCLKSYVPVSQHFKTKINTVGLFENFPKKSELMTVLEEIYEIIKV